MLFILACGERVRNVIDDNVRIGIAQYQFAPKDSVLKPLRECRKIQQQRWRSRLQGHICWITLIDLKLFFDRFGMAQGGADGMTVMAVEGGCDLAAEVLSDLWSKNLALLRSRASDANFVREFLPLSIEFCR